MYNKTNTLLVDFKFGKRGERGEPMIWTGSKEESADGLGLVGDADRIKMLYRICYEQINVGINKEKM